MKALLSCRICRPLAAGEIHPWTRPCQSQTSLKLEQVGQLRREGGWTLAQVSGMDKELQTSSSHHFSLERERDVAEKLLSPRYKKPLSG